MIGIAGNGSVTAKVKLCKFRRCLFFDVSAQARSNRNVRLLNYTLEQKGEHFRRVTEKIN